MFRLEVTDGTDLFSVPLGATRLHHITYLMSSEQEYIDMITHNYQHTLCNICNFGTAALIAYQPGYFSGISN